MISTKNQTAREGNDISLVCAAEGNPSPRVIWIAPNGTVLQDRTSDTNLMLPNVSRHRSGKYLCSVTNRVGSDSKIVYLDVLCKFPPLYYFSYIFPRECIRVLERDGLLEMELRGALPYCFPNVVSLLDRLLVTIAAFFFTKGDA